MAEFSHLDANGRLRMVDISRKKRSLRTAVAAARVRMNPETARAIVAGEVQKGEVIACAKLAGIAAAKRTDELIPLCHPLALSWLDVQIAVDADHCAIRATARAADATGVEMEALMAASVAALTVYDMCKAIDPGMCVESLRLVSKTGGKSDWSALQETATAMQLSADGVAQQPACPDDGANQRSTTSAPGRVPPSDGSKS